MSPSLVTEVVKLGPCELGKGLLITLLLCMLLWALDFPSPANLRWLLHLRKARRPKRCSPAMTPAKRVTFLMLTEGSSVVAQWRLNSNSCSVHHLLSSINVIPSWRIACRKANIYWGHIASFSGQYQFLEPKGFINDFSYSLRHTW